MTNYSFCYENKQKQVLGTLYQLPDAFAVLAWTNCMRSQDILKSHVAECSTQGSCSQVLEVVFFLQLFTV